MIKDVMVRLDGTPADEVRLTAVNGIAKTFESRIKVLFFNPLPLLLPAEAEGLSTVQATELIQRAREAGDKIEAELIQHLARHRLQADIRRFDVFGDELTRIAAREARAADTFVALRPNGAAEEPERMVEGVLFGSGRHVFLVPGRKPPKVAFDRILVAWNGSREAARALAEGVPYLQQARKVTVVTVVEDAAAEESAMLGEEAVAHLKHHAIPATLHRARNHNGDVGATLLREAQQLDAELVVMGGYGHSRLREWLLGGATYTLLHKSPVPLVLAN